MLARLWWKEYRIFGPVLLTLVLFAAGFELLLVSARGEDINSATLMTVALIWAGLYAFAVGAAAFAGERESNTLGFLDALPVGRGTLWLGKTTFALASTLGLSLLLAGLAALGAVALPTPEPDRAGSTIATLGPILFEAVAWGLLWSALSRNALLAGAMAVVSVGLSSIVSTWLVDSLFEVGSGGVATWIIAARLLLATLALAGSAPGLAWRPSWGGRIPGRTESTPPGPVAIRASSTGRSLAWQAWREGRTTWVLVGLVGLWLPVAVSLLGLHSDGSLEVLLGGVAGLVAGVSVFGAENASGSRRFLVHHGVKPGSVWSRKVLIWGVGMASLLGLALLGLSRYVSASRFYGTTEELLGRFVIVAANAFAVGLLCGMAIRRRITAALVGVMALVVLLPIQYGLISAEMVPTRSLFLVPLILAGISRAWAADWLLEREGARPWVRLGLLVALPFGLLFGAFVSYRAFGVRDVGPQFDEATLRASAVPPDRDAMPAYRRAAGLIVGVQGAYSSDNGASWAPLDALIENGWDPDQTQIVDYWKRNQPALDLARKALAMPRARFGNLGPMSKDPEEWKAGRGVRLLEQLLALDTRERLSRGDRPGAWDDILAHFRMANQFATSTPNLSQMILAIQFHHRAVALTFDWLGDPRQSPEATRKALADLKALPTLPNLSEAMRVESLIIERTLDQSGDDLADLLLPSLGNARPSTFDYLLFAKVIAAPWERLRARKVWRRLVAEEVPAVGDEPWRRARHPEETLWNDPGFRSSKLAQTIIPSFAAALLGLDRELTSRRALEQAIALVAWKLDHAGEYPSTLEALVPGLLGKLPLDPFSGRPFGYVRSNGQEISSPLSEALRPTRPGQPILYSIGADRVDDGGTSGYGSNQSRSGDYLYIVP